MLYCGMGIWDRLGNVIKSYLNDEDKRIFGNSGGYAFSGDPDVDSAFDELNEYLNRGRAGPSEGSGRGYDSWGDDGSRNKRAGRAGGTFPEALRPDFAELGVAFGASAEECKTAYKKLLKIHHPDRHAGHAGNFKKATDKSARINAAYDRIEKWRRDESAGAS